MAAPGSLHGYDVTNPARINPEIGTREDLQRFAGRLKQHGMGVMADVVPNHMCVDDAANEWWWDVLENGPSSQFAEAARRQSGGYRRGRSFEHVPWHD
jgi:(1->4)-alpha-D-glucan 1-alpha-D-glucosylmutase